LKTYNLKLRHAASKRKINALANNRLAPLKKRLASDGDAIVWARDELIEFASRRSGPFYRYMEAALTELLPFGAEIDGKDYRRLGRWVANADGLAWRESPVGADA
jgi:hypothetical protein